MPLVRAVVRGAAPRGYTFAAFVTGIVTSPAFRMKGADAPVVTTAGVAGQP